jgi:hypothetical protein
MLKGSMSGDVHDFNNIEMRAVIKFHTPPPQARAPEVILKETLGEHAPSYATVKNWVAQFKRGDFLIIPVTILVRHPVVFSYN